MGNLNTLRLEHSDSEVGEVEKKYIWNLRNHMNDKASEIISRDFSHLSSKALLLVNDLVKEKLRLLNLLLLEWRRVEGTSSLPGHTLTFRGLFGRVHHFCRVTQGDTVSYGYLEEGEPGCRALSMENWSVEIHNSSYDVLVGDDRRARLQPLRGGQLRGAAVPCDLGRGGAADCFLGAGAYEDGDIPRPCCEDSVVCCAGRCEEHLGVVLPTTATLHVPSQPRASACRHYLALVYTSSSEEREEVHRLSASEAEVGWCQDQDRPGSRKRVQMSFRMYNNKKRQKYNVHLSLRV